MRISDWSSDVCSSDLTQYPAWIEPPQGRWFPQFCCRKIGTPIAAGAAATRSLTRFTPYRAPPSVFHMTEEIMTVEQHIEELRATQIGRASGRARECTYV